MPLARMMLSRSQRCSSKRRTCGSPRVSRTGCGGLMTFIACPLVVSARRRLFRLRARGLENRCPARALLLENACRLVGADVEHRLEAQPEQLGLELGIGHGLLGDRVDALEDWPRRAGGSEHAEGGLRDHAGHSRFDRGWNVGRALGAGPRI